MSNLIEYFVAQIHEGTLKEKYDILHLHGLIFVGQCIPYEVNTWFYVKPYM